MRPRLLLAVCSAVLALPLSLAHAQERPDPYAAIDRTMSQAERLGSEIESCIAKRDRLKAQLRSTVVKRKASSLPAETRFVEVAPASRTYISPPAHPVAQPTGPAAKISLCPVSSPEAYLPPEAPCFPGFDVDQPLKNKAVLASMLKEARGAKLSTFSYYPECAAFWSFDLTMCDVLLNAPAITPVEESIRKQLTGPFTGPQQADKCKATVKDGWIGRGSLSLTLGECKGQTTLAGYRACRSVLLEKSKRRAAEAIAKEKKALTELTPAQKAQLEKSRAAQAARAEETKAKEEKMRALQEAARKAHEELMERQKKDFLERKRRMEADYLEHSGADISEQAKLQTAYQQANDACVKLVKDLMSVKDHAVALVTGFEPKSDPGLQSHRDDLEALEDRVNDYYKRVLPCTGKEKPGTKFCEGE